MRSEDFLEALAREGVLLIDAALRAGADALVPTCPDWRVRDLVLHQGNVHRWATGFVVEGRTAFAPLLAERVSDGELEGWFREGHATLLAALRQAPKDLECWTFLPGARSPRHFWTRRQAHETTVHRVDAESAAGGAGVGGGGGVAVGAEFAVDGVDELLTGFHARERSRVRSARERTLGVRTTDGPGACWRVVISDAPPRAERVEALAEPVECEVSGPAEEVYLALWNRRPWDGVTVTGDASVAELWRGMSAI
ncbi:maleylpyruvate isomerase family mycothiol-dependent enzyme [Streptomyces sp. 4N509B]|uniref:maleylpyruvate isomerase family mycothiol-dependent enzyme n=1 Tax=Streptomyces sp. 4N509B TaxID=3457413 RepID=UPI003FD64882